MQDQGLQTGEGRAEKVAEKTGALQKGAGNLAHAGKRVNRSLFFRRRRKRLRNRDLQGSSRMAVRGAFFSELRGWKISLEKECIPLAFLIKAPSRLATERQVGALRSEKQSSFSSLRTLPVFPLGG